ncbi:MAG: glycosyltransferase [Vicinamibacterales bacterium]
MISAGAGADGRIALIFSSLRPGGVERIRLTLARGFLQRGLAVDLVIVNAEGPLAPDLPEGARVIDLRKRRTIHAFAALVRYFRRERPLAALSAQTHLNLVTLAARVASRAPGRIAVSEHIALDAVLRHAATWKERLFPIGVKLLYPHADAVVAVCRATAERFSSASGLPLDRIAVIYNPVVTADLVERSQAPIEDEWLGDGKPPVILSAGRLTPQKDHETLLRAFALVRRTRPCRLLVLGEGSERDRLERIARDLGVETHVRLAGFAINPFPYMRRARLFALSSRWEGFGNVLVEAMACGLPVVSTDCPSGPAEILQDGAWGLLVPVGDPGALASAILQSMDEPPQSERLRARAAEFSADRAVDRYLQVLLP